MALKLDGQILAHKAVLEVIEESVAEIYSYLKITSPTLFHKSSLDSDNDLSHGIPSEIKFIQALSKFIVALEILEKMNLNETERKEVEEQLNFISYNNMLSLVRKGEPEILFKLIIPKDSLLAKR